MLVAFQEVFGIAKHCGIGDVVLFHWNQWRNGRGRQLEGSIQQQEEQQEEEEEEEEEEEDLQNIHPWKRTMFVRERIARSAWDNVSEMLSVLFILLIVVIEKVAGVQNNNKQPFCLITCARTEENMGDILITLFTMMLVRLGGMVLSAKIINRLAKMYGSKSASKGGAYASLEKTLNRSQSKRYLVAVKSLLKGHSYIIVAAYAYVISEIVRSLFRIEHRFGGV